MSCAFEAAAGRGVGVLGTGTFTGFLSGAILSHAVARFSLRSTRLMKVLTIAATLFVFSMSITGNGFPSRKNTTAVIYRQEVCDVCVIVCA